MFKYHLLLITKAWIHSVTACLSLSRNHDRDQASLITVVSLYMTCYCVIGCNMCDESWITYLGTILQVLPLLVNFENWKFIFELRHIVPLIFGYLLPVRMKDDFLSCCLMPSCRNQLVSSCFSVQWLWLVLFPRCFLPLDLWLGCALTIVHAA